MGAPVGRNQLQQPDSLYQEKNYPATWGFLFASLFS